MATLAAPCQIAAEKCWRIQVSDKHSAAEAALAEATRKIEVLMNERAQLRIEADSKILALEQQVTQQAATISQLREALKKAEFAMCASNDPFNIKVWTDAVNAVEAALASTQEKPAIPRRKSHEHHCK
jgi:trehalose-6-phosphatase